MMKYLLSIAIMTQAFCLNLEEEMSAYRFNGKKLNLTEQEWRDFLPTEQFEVLRKDGTEPAFQNAYYDNKEDGIYVCLNSLASIKEG